MIQIHTKGSFDNLLKFLNATEDMSKLLRRQRIESLAQQGVERLKQNTPVRSGETAAAWSYDIVEKDGVTSIYWTNSNVQDNVNIAIILQYGHATRNGGYVEGRDYINEALRPIFDKMTMDMWKAVTTS